ncbi:ribonuclease E inhibitor RraB [Pseudomonas sp. MBLB4123]|uniref:ribonuclease E inhibitor RraB n=1 Tax=Pseudomonas sp. MBLB4123 TaxID=3451557 RepID=UPI003F74BC34
MRPTFKAAILAIFLTPYFASGAGSEMITKDSLVEMFENISNNTEWDLSSPLLWGYFFTSSKIENLHKSASDLEADGYRFVKIFLSGKDNPDEPDLWWLHVEKIETHTPDSLFDRNKELYQFASEHHLDSYDGMDVGPVGGKH